MCSFNTTDTNILDIIKCRLKEIAKSQKELCKYLGLSQQTFTEWNGGRSNSYMKYLPQIADFLDVSVDYLLGKTDKKNKTAPEEQSLTDEQEALLNYCSDLSNDDLEKVIDYIELLKLKNNAAQKASIKLVARSGEQKQVSTDTTAISELKEDTSSDY